MATGITGAMMTLQLLLLAALISIALSGTIPSEKHGEVHKGGEVTEKVKEVPTVGMLPAHIGNTARAKRYIGWGRRPGLRYSKATSVFDNDPSSFNRIYNRFEKRGENGPEAPISNFRELRMKQKVPNIQLLLPHLFNRNNRIRIPAPGSLDMDNALPGSGSDLGILDGEGPVRLNEEDVDALMYYLEDYAKNLHGNDQV